MKSKREVLCGAARVAALGALLGTGQMALAQAEFPAKLITLVVPFTPGSGTDVSARRLGKALSEVSGQPVVVENRAGGNNAIGVRHVVGAAPDGYTLLVGTNSPVAGNVAVFKSLPYDPVKSLAPVAPLSRQDWVLVVKADAPYKTLADLVAAGKKDPRLLSAGGGSTGYQLAALMFGKNAGIEVNVIPYPGTPQAVQDVMGGQVVFSIVDAGSVLQLLRAGSLRPLATLSDRRVGVLPEVPTLRELGQPSIPLMSWAGVFAPVATPPMVISRLTALIEKALTTPDVQTYYVGIGADIQFGGADKLRQMQVADIANYRDAMKSTGLPQQ